MVELESVELQAQQKQDLFALYLIGSNGTFLDIGCGHPVWSNNTVFLENLGWTGMLFDINLDSEAELAVKERTSPVTCLDVTTTEFIETIKTYGVSNFDYISLDIDKKGFECLELLIKNEITFKCMTFEHDYYRYQDHLKTPSKELLETSGYHPLFENVEHEFGFPFEDWWIDPSQFPQSLLDLSHSDIHYLDCISILEVNDAIASR